MSGGHYEYKCFEVSRFAELVEMDVKSRQEKRDIDQGGGYVYTQEALPKPLLDKMQAFSDVMKICGSMARDIEWFMSGDTGEDKTIADLHKGLTEIGGIIDRHYSV